VKPYFIKTPGILEKIFSKYTWRFSADKKELFLTFDDGPTTKITTFVLDQLKRHKAKATFFCIGKNIQQNPALFQRIIEDKHTIGNHTQQHLNGWKNNTEAYIHDFLKCEHAISNLIEKPQETRLFRPPYGKIKKRQAKEILKKNYRIVMWDVLSADFDTSISKEKCLENVLKNTKNGSIIVFHDSVKASEKVQYALPKVLEYFSKKGYLFKAIQ
jgi:peptidoglycan/xylan/chitin deacetylase (PgdA/CDA1 family)